MVKLLTSKLVGNAGLPVLDRALSSQAGVHAQAEHRKHGQLAYSVIVFARCRLFV